MAKNPVTQFNINAAKAVKALADVTAGLKGYNKEVREAAKQHKAFNAVADKARTSMQGFARETAKGARATQAFVQNLTTMKSQVNAVTSGLNRLNSSTATLATTTQAAAHFMLFAAKNAARLGVDLGNAAAATRNYTRSIDRDTQAVKNNTVAFRALSKEIGRVVKDMQLKNRTIDQQVAAAQRDQQSTRELKIGYEELAKIIGIQLVHRAFSELIRGMVESVSAAQELRVRIGEIQTVSLEMSGSVLKTAKSTDEWTRSLLALSANMGINTLDQAEGIYDALSNQVVKASTATAFMAEEMKLAITTVSTLKQAVDVTSTVINAYGKTSNDAASINAVLFRGVDVGRFRLEELGSSFGRTNVLANQLGVSFEEVVGTLALLTRLGLQADVANTLLTNTFNGLIKPSKELQAIFQKWGVSSAEAALQTFGFAGVFKKLAAEVSNGTGVLSETAQIFDDLRALTGASGLIKNLDGLEKSINDVTNATNNYNTAFDTQMKNLGVRGRIQLEKFKQFFLITFGLPAQRLIVEWTEAMGGATNVLQKLVQIVRIAAVAYVSLRTATNFFAAANTRAAAAAAAAASGVTVQTAANHGLIASFRSLSAAQAGATLGLSLLVTVLAEVVAQSLAAEASYELFRTELESKTIEEARKNFEAFNAVIDENTKLLEKSFRAVSREWLETIAKLRQINNSLSDDFDKTFKKIRKSMKEALDGATEGAEAGLKKLRKEIEAAEKAIEKAKDRLSELKTKNEDDAFDASIATHSDVDKVKAIEEEKRRIFNQAIEARRKGEDDLADDLLKREEELREKQIELLKKIREEASKEVVVGRTVVDTNGNITRTDIDGESKTSVRFRAARPARNVRRLPGSGRTFTRAGTAPTATVTKTETEKEQKDTALAVAAERALARIEAERVEQRKRLITLEEELIKKKEAQVALQKKEEESRKKAFEAFKETVGQIDAFDKTGDAAGLKSLIGTAEEQGRAAGLDSKDLFAFLREANKLRLELARKEVKDETELRLQALEREVADAEKIKNASLHKRVDAEKEFQRQVNDIIKNNLLATADLDRELSKKFILLEPSLLTKEQRTANQGVLNAQKALAEVERITKALQQKQATARENGTGFVTKEDLQNLDEAQSKLTDALRVLDAIKGVANVSLGGLIIHQTTRDAQGRLAFNAGKGEIPEAFVARAKSLQTELAKAKESANIVIEAQNEINTSMQVEQLAQQERNRLESQYGDLKRAAEDQSERGVIAQQRINKELDRTIERLQQINAMRTGGQQLANGGIVNYRAFGGQGTDRQLTATSAGEFISTRLATRQYAPLLHALNKQPPLLRANGGDTLNFGDVHIHAPEGTTSVQAQDIAVKLTRLSRQGRYKPKG